MTSSIRRTRILLSAAIVVLVLLLVFVMWLFARLQAEKPDLGSATTDLTWVRSIYGSGKAESDQLLSPSSVAVAPNGDIYVTDPIRSRVLVFSSAGEYRRVVASSEPGYLNGQFVRPEAIAVDSDTGDLYIADSWARKILVFDDQGEFSREWYVDEQARGVSVRGDRVFVLDVGKVIVFNAHGVRITEFGQRGALEGQIDAYQGIIADDERIYVADSYNRRIQAFTYDGEVVWTQPSVVETRAPVSMDESIPSAAQVDEALADVEWELPQDLTIDGAGRLVVVDAFLFRIVVVNPNNGRVVASFGEYGQTDGRFFYPTSIDYDAERDWFVVADTQNNRVQIVRVPGSEGGALAPLRRAAASPWRYLVIPLAVFFAAALVAAWNRLRSRGVSKGVGG